MAFEISPESILSDLTIGVGLIPYRDMVEESNKKPLLDQKTLNPFDPNLDLEIADTIATLFISLVRKQGEYHPQGGKGKKITRNPTR